jgi:hypothetical protein
MRAASAFCCEAGTLRRRKGTLGWEKLADPPDWRWDGNPSCSANIFIIIYIYINVDTEILYTFIY